jgi:rRNA large subunit m3Psi methyltransferase RlmH
MNIEIICIGNLKEPWLKDAEKEYLKRLSPYLKLTITELSETKLPKNSGKAEEEAVKEKEGEALLNSIEKYRDAFVFALDMRGKQFSSEKFSEQISELTLQGKSTFVFLIGGSLGLSEKTRKKADKILSFSEMTFPHQLMRVILLEQIYRSQKIQRGEPYHK